MMEVGAIKSALKDRKIKVVAQATGLNRQTLYSLLNNSAHNPSYATVKKLSDYLSA